MEIKLGKAIVFPEIMHGCESWTIRRLNAEQMVLLKCDAGEES